MYLRKHQHLHGNVLDQCYWSCLIATITFKGIPVAFRFVLVSGYLARFGCCVLCFSVKSIYFRFDTKYWYWTIIIKQNIEAVVVAQCKMPLLNYCTILHLSNCAFVQIIQSWLSEWCCKLIYLMRYWKVQVKCLLFVAWVA